ncbi:hypothetical protein [Pandoraea anhela]|uniref:hypothetical protein n=1 Tax=Pandoraea anhela TaxID=2508295 RepID=UPI0012404151|nr:hypothetical protein [Pandoraea anhela]
MARSLVLRLVLWAALVPCASAQSLTGADVAFLVNQRYQSTVSQCAAGRAAWMCSGVLIRPLSGDSSRDVASLSAAESALGSASVVYLRQDIGTSSLSESAGVILADGLTAAGRGTPISVRCAYPFAPTLASGMSANGCDLLANSSTAVPDASTCASHGVMDVVGWTAHFAAQSRDVQRQCSLSATDAKQFRASIDTHGAVSPEFSKTSNALLLVAWDPRNVQTMPAQAFFYDPYRGGQLLQAQRYQKQYFDASRQWLPILQMRFDERGKAAFGFDESDQLDIGYQVAERLNARFADTSDTCPGQKPGFYCNGILIRVAEANPLFHAWDPSPQSMARNGVSFTYLRADAHVTVLIEDRGATGFIVKESSAPAAYPLTVRCSFPSDGWTGGRTDSCNAGTDPRLCDELGVTTIATWQQHYLPSELWTQCAFRPDIPSFQLSIDVRQHFPKVDVLRNADNEVIIKPWPRGIPLELPLEAFIILGDGVGDGRYVQQDYMNTTGRFLPLIRVDPVATHGKVFSYVPGDQIAALSSTVPPPKAQ